MAFKKLGLSDKVITGIESAGYETPTPIQEQAIPIAIEGKDVIGASQTGTGKTAAFALPIIHKLGEHGAMRCLILEPVRELASQVLDNLELLGSGTNLKSLLIHGGVGYGKQIDGIKSGVDILIATPGRLIDLMEKGVVKLDKIEIMVLDEVDRMLDMGFLPDVRKIVGKTPRSRQTLFFSATMPPAIDSLAKWALNDPTEVEIGKRQGIPDTVSHAFYPVALGQREELLLALIKQTNFKSVMIFTRTKKDADTLAKFLGAEEGQYSITVMHSDIRQKDRERALEGFKKGDFDVIIATDLAARGIDISNVSHVINYQVPENAEDYVHRIGRTGRANREGDAFTLLAADELDHANSVERFIEQKIERRKIEGFKYHYTTLLDDDAPTPEKLAKVFSRRRKGGGRRKRR
ncbi:DEAD/DEAH box helicase [Verrucomicrobiales bacterium]|nr:DEAD/DEAH box helicase [Verrucomicrobiales bacterium]MDC0048369.1 DEAD/DEAH box helicase [Verrucomicrobiota bacterium]|tara:strand:+ start:2398 stop:3618 length:1221 start_codon:yes stop_codon:yes gene_type:complete